jgi:hypothetical protein
VEIAPLRVERVVERGISLIRAAENGSNRRPPGAKLASLQADDLARRRTWRRLCDGAHAACSCTEWTEIGTPGSDFDARIDSADLT